MLGKPQREWLLRSMRESDAEFFFVVSSVPFMIPHSGAGGFESDAANKEEAWTGFFDEREKLITEWDKIGKKVFVMTGDLHTVLPLKLRIMFGSFAAGPTIALIMCRNSTRATVRQRANGSLGLANATSDGAAISCQTCRDWNACIRTFVSCKSTTSLTCPRS